MDDFTAMHAGSALEQHYAGRASAQLGASAATRPPRPLEGIGIAADRIAKVNERLMEIFERFHGTGPRSDAPCDPISIAYVNQVSRLHSNIEQLENLVSSLADAA